MAEDKSSELLKKEILGVVLLTILDLKFQMLIVTGIRRCYHLNFSQTGHRNLMGTLNPLPNMFTQTSLLFSVEAWMVDDLLVRNAQRELDMMGNNLFQVVVEQMGQLDQCIQLLEEINALRRELLTILPQLVHAPENVNTNALLHRAPLNPFLSEFPSLECVTKIWREDTILDVIFPPLVETPALIRSPGGTSRVGMQIITRWDLDVTQQRIFRARLTPLQDVNHQEQC
ncbi:hypothetical protein C5167_024767, partial [Papaver somniferum]